MRRCALSIGVGAAARAYRILVGLSDSRFGDAAVWQAVRLSRDGDHVVGVFVPPALNAATIPPGALAQLQAEQAQRVAHLFDRARKVCGARWPGWA